MICSILTLTRPARHTIPFVILSVLSPVGGACSDEDGAAGDDVRTLVAPELSMPFAKGTSHMCTQGNGGEKSHSGAITAHALDLDTYGGETIVSALAGRVGYVQSDCLPNDSKCGGYFGNHVKLDHGGGYYTLYAHLGAPAVKTGDVVGRGVVVGQEGGTGDTSGSHLHFSLHHGDPSSATIDPTVSFSLRSRDDTEGEGVFSSRASGNFVCALPNGHMYASDNECLVVYESRGDAKVIMNESVYAGEFCSVGDTDYFYFFGGPKGFEARITSTDQSMAECDCAILDESGVELQVGGAEGYDRDDKFNDGKGCKCTLATVPPGKYFLRVFSQMPGAYHLAKTLPNSPP